MRETAGKGSAAAALVPVSPAPLVELVLDSLASPHSRRAYRRALGEFFAWYPSNASGEGFTRAVLGRYRSHLIERGLSAASVNLALAALRKLAIEAAGHRRDPRRPDRQLADLATDPTSPGRLRPRNDQGPAGSRRTCDTTTRARDSSVPIPALCVHVR